MGGSGDNNPNWSWGGAGTGGLSGAATGAQVGGPWGALIGGVAGAGLGGLTGNKGKTKPPDYMALAGQANNYGTPWGSLQDGQFSVPWEVGQTLGSLQGGMRQAATMDPSQARNQAIGANLGWGMQQLNPILQQQNQQYRSEMANTGASPQAAGAARTMLGNQQGGMLGGVLTNALNEGNAAQYAQMAQAMLPYQQYNSLIGSSLQRPSSPNLLGAGMMAYGANAQNAAIGQGNKNNLMGGIGQAGSLMQGKNQNNSGSVDV